MSDVTNEARSPWSEDALLNTLEAELSSHGMKAVRRVRETILNCGGEYLAGSAKSPSATYSLSIDGKQIRVITFYSHQSSYPEFAIGFQNLQSRGVSAERIKRFAEALCESSEMAGFI